jgi:hypothetical protein
MMSARFAAGALFAFLPAIAAAHVVELGYATLVGRCSVMKSVKSCIAFGAACVETPQISNSDQRLKVSAVIVPNKAVENRERNDMIIACAADVTRELGVGTLANEGVRPEAAFKSEFNACLRKRHAPFEADVVLLRREPQPCEDR